ncbi:phosphatase PAP2 family protein [Phocaeicola sp.]
MKKYQLMTIIICYIAVLLVIAVFLNNGDGVFSQFFENSNLYIRSWRNAYTPTFHQSYDNFLLVFPLLLLLGLKLGGVRGSFGWKRLLTFIVLSLILTQLAVNVLKLTTGVLRPDESNYFSFPSGHTATAFMAATLLYKEYGFKGYWVGLVAYAAAIITGFTRILNNRHWLFDVIIGAALGILLTDLAYRLVQLIFKERGWIRKE